MRKQLFLLLNFFALLLATGAFVSCKKENRWDLFKSTGDIVKQTRTLAPFDSIYVEDNVNVIITEDSTTYEATVEAGEHLVDLVRTEVVNGELRIRNDNKCNFVRSYKKPMNVYIRAKNTLTRITSKGTGTVSSTNALTAPVLKFETKSSGFIDIIVNSPRVFTWQHGDGDITLHGYAGELDIYNVGYGFTIAQDCNTSYTWAHASTTGKVTCAASDLLIVEIYSSGNVYYRGNPGQILKKVYATGNLLPL